MEVVNMNLTDGNQVQMDASQLIPPPKRKRGRPRKNHILYPGEKLHAPQRVEGKRKPRRKKMDSVSSFTDNAFVGQTVHGVLDGSFDAGYLLTVRVGNTDTVLRGVVFEPGLSVPISKANDIAPNVKLTRREENIVPPPSQPQPVVSIQSPSFTNTPSTPAPVHSVPLCLPASSSQAMQISAQALPVQSTPVVANQTCSTGAPSNGFSPKPDNKISFQPNEDSSSKPSGSLSFLHQAISTTSTESKSKQQLECNASQQPVQILMESTVQGKQAVPVAADSAHHHDQQPSPIPAESIPRQQVLPLPVTVTVTGESKQITNPSSEPVSHRQPPVSSGEENVAQVEQPPPESTERPPSVKFPNRLAEASSGPPQDITKPAPTVDLRMNATESAREA